MEVVGQWLGQGASDRSIENDIDHAHAISGLVSTKVDLPPAAAFGDSHEIKQCRLTGLSVDKDKGRFSQHRFRSPGPRVAHEGVGLTIARRRIVSLAAMPSSVSRSFSRPQQGASAFAWSFSPASVFCPLVGHHLAHFKGKRVSFWMASR